MNIYIYWQGRVVVEFEWDEAKAARNLEKHGIDFAGAAAFFAEPQLVVPSHHGREVRWKAIGLVGVVEITVVFTVRHERIRLISARRAGKNERQAYHKAIQAAAGEGQD